MGPTCATALVLLLLLLVVLLLLLVLVLQHVHGFRGADRGAAGHGPNLVRHDGSDSLHVMLLLCRMAP